MWHFRLSPRYFRRFIFFVVWRVLGRCYPTFRYIHVPLCSYLMSRRTIWLNIEDGSTTIIWNTRNYSLSESSSYPKRLETPAAMCLRIRGIMDVCLSVVAVQIFFATDRSVCTCWRYIQLSYVFGGCVRLNPTEESGDCGKAEVPQPYEHNCTQARNARGCTPPRILNAAFDRNGTVARFSLLDSGGSCPT